MPWFAVKTLYRIFAQGKPNARDEFYDSDGALVEERVLLLHADSHDAAIIQAETDARSYECVFENAYGQKVQVSYLEVCDAFACTFSGEPTDGCEVWSSVRRVPVGLRDELIAEQFLPPQLDSTELNSGDDHPRKKFVAINPSDDNA